MNKTKNGLVTTVMKKRDVNDITFSINGTTASRKQCITSLIWCAMKTCHNISR